MALLALRDAVDGHPTNLRWGPPLDPRGSLAGGPLECEANGNIPVERTKPRATRSRVNRIEKAGTLFSQP